jgi:hypothetical protein
MKRYFVGIAVLGILSLGVMGFINIPLLGLNHADACGRMGKSGGGDYTPQQRSQVGSYFNRPALTKEQAYDVLANHVKKINPDLEIGEIKDGGGFYEAEILSEEKEVVERLAVDKKSGQLRVIY